MRKRRRAAGHCRGHGIRTAKEGDVWSCGKGSTRRLLQTDGTVVAVMRVINLKAA